METEKMRIWRNGSDPARPWERVRAEPRGTLYQLVSGQPFCHLVTIVCPAFPDAFRGRHFHRKKREEFFCVTGTMVFHWFDLDTKAYGSVAISAGDRMLILPNLVHAFVAETDSILIEFCNEPYDEEDSLPGDPVALAGAISGRT